MIETSHPIFRIRKQYKTDGVATDYKVNSMCRIKWLLLKISKNKIL